MIKKVLIFFIFYTLTGCINGQIMLIKKGQKTNLRTPIFTKKRQKGAKVEPKQTQETSTAVNYEINKQDLYNHHLDDIKYSLVKTNNSFTAIGYIDKQIENNKKKIDLISYSDPIDGILSQHIYNDEDILNILIDSSTEIEEKAKEQEKPQEARTNNAKKLRKFNGKNILLSETSFKKITGWDNDNLYYGLESFLNSCKVLNRKYPNRMKQTNDFIFGTAKDWLEVCEKGEIYYEKNKAKEFFEKYFTPFKVYDKNNKTEIGKFTGYYEFLIEGSLKKTSRYKYPLYKKPEDCKKNRTNCPTRKEIANGKLNNKNLEICWTENPYDVWKMQLQGSGIVQLENNSFLRVSFGGHNHKKAESVWKNFSPKAHMKGVVNGNSVQNWLRKNHDFAAKLINKNPSYTFFTPNNKAYATGAEGSKLTSSRSIAVDRKNIAYGMPIWIDSKLPIKNEKDKSWIKLNRMMVSQDTGKMIKGSIRADIFFGHGDKASYLANHTNFNGKYYILLPKSVAKRTKVK